MDVHWPCSCTAQSSILSIGSVSVAPLLGIFLNDWTVVAFPCFTVVKFFTSWYAFLLLFFLRFSSLAFFKHLLMLLFTSLYFSASSGSNLFFLSSLLFVTQIKNFCSDPGFFLLTMFAKDLNGCFSHSCVEGGDH